MRIGEFSKYVKTTVKTLRYYDTLGLFSPAYTDPETGYRNYTPEQLAEFEQIRQYRAAGLSVELIRRLLAGEDRLTVLHEQKRELSRQEALLRRQKEAVAALMASPPANVYDVVLKELPAYTVCTCRGRVPDAAHIVSWSSERLREMKRLFPTLEIPKPHYCCITFTDTSHQETNPAVEYAEAVVAPRSDREGFVFKTLPGGTMACVEHHGSYEEIAAAYAALLRWITASGRPIVGAVRERFVHGAWDRENEADWLTEIQVPLGKETKSL